VARPNYQRPVAGAFFAREPAIEHRLTRPLLRVGLYCYEWIQKVLSFVIASGIQNLDYVDGHGHEGSFDEVEYPPRMLSFKQVCAAITTK
jgi:hypothetical protein